LNLKYAGAYIRTVILYQHNSADMKKGGFRRNRLSKSIGI